jgi:hypothetical protein
MAGPAATAPPEDLRTYSVYKDYQKRRRVAKGFDGLGGQVQVIDRIWGEISGLPPVTY